MPVPLTATHSNRVGLQAAQNAELPSSGPFSRMFGSNADTADIDQEKKSSSQQNLNASTTAPPNTHLSVDQSNPQTNDIPALATNNLTFFYCDIDGRPFANKPPVVQNMTLSIPKGATVLLTGPNGAGKTTLLKVLGGKHMVPEGSVQILGQPPFHATNLTTSGDLSYIGGNWERDVAFAGYAIPLAADIPASQMLHSLPGTDPARLARLIDVLDINPSWRMHLVSDGQRRRVQIAMGLLKPFKILLLDEITVDLDVLGRADLMNFLKEECEQRGASIIYATHIFDGLESWPSHVMYVAEGTLKEFRRSEEIPELQQGKLLELVEKWLRGEKKVHQNGGKGENMEYVGDKGSSLKDGALWNNGWACWKADIEHETEFKCSIALIFILR